LFNIVDLMGAHELLSFLCAALAALGNALANVMQRKASVEEAPDEPFGLTVMLRLVRSPVWILGFSGMVAAFALQAVALGLGELAAVEPVITLEVPLTLLVASYVFQRRLGRQEWTGIIIMTAAMITLVAALNPQAGDESNVSHIIYIVAGAGTAATIVALIAGARHGRVVWRTACLGAAAGASFGLTATLVKETVNKLTGHGILAVLGTWQTYVAVGFGVFGVILMQWALHTGPLAAAQPGFTLMDPLVSILWGVLVYREATRTGAWLVLATVGAIGVGVGVAVLARAPLLLAVNDADVNHLGPATKQAPDFSRACGRGE
jgi:drug/metabolite transporter (DMT)-like permease